MKILVCGDVHWSQYSSILRGRGEKYSARLENLIQSLNWVNDMATTNKCDVMVFLGDFFDRADLNAEEITALDEIKWNSTRKYFLCGNHEMASNDHEYSSAKIFATIPGTTVIDTPTTTYDTDCFLRFLPYVLESNRKPMSEYFDIPNDRTIMFSHNDIRGVQMGAFLSQAGFSVEEFEDNAGLTFNGHLHNGTKVTDKVINLGNLTGQNFCEDALKYKHQIAIIDTDKDDIGYRLIENPYAYKFYTLNEDDPIVMAIDAPAVVSITCSLDRVDEIKKELAEDTRVVASRVSGHCEVIATTNEIAETVREELVKTNHIEAFKTFVREKICGDSELVNIIEQELSSVCQ